MHPNNNKTSPEFWMEPSEVTEETPVPDTRTAIVELGRRGFLTGMGIGGVVSLLGCERIAVRHALPYLTAPEFITPGLSVDYASTCQGCSAACGLRVTTRDGRPIKLEGLETHQLSQGGLCATGQAEIRGLYDAGRLRQPTIAGKEQDWNLLDERIVNGLAKSKASQKDVFVVSRTILSHTARHAIENFLKPFGGTHLEYESPVDSMAGILAAYNFLDSKEVVPSLKIEEADLLIGFGADLLGAGSEPVAHTAQYANRRKQRSTRDFRHIQFEGSLTLTGAAADERVSATASDRHLIILELLKRAAATQSTPEAAKIGRLIGSVPSLDTHQTIIKRTSQELLRAKGKSLVVSGSNNVAEQVAVALLNRLLGNEGNTLNLESPSITRQGREESIKELQDALKSKSVGTVFFLDCNPVEEIPDGDVLAEQLKSIELSVALTDRPNATTRSCEVVAAAHHALESWGDASPREDLLTIVQPTIRPLFNTRHALESFLVWGGAAQTDYRIYLREYWQSHHYNPAKDGEFKQFWVKALSSGSAKVNKAPEIQEERSADKASEESNAAEVSPGEAALAETVTEVVSGPSESVLARHLSAPKVAPDGEIEFDLVAEVALRNGRNSFNPWLRELSDPLTRMAWTGAIRVAPSRAKKLGVTDGDLVALKSGDKEIQMPVRIIPGQHPNVLGVPVGYGLIDGDAGESARNVYQLASWQGNTIKRYGLSGTVRKLGGSTKLPIIQPHPLSEGRPIIGQVSTPNEKLKMGHHGPAHSLWEKRDYKTHWDMVIDLDACTGCSACVISCQAENNLPVVGPDEIQQHRDMNWLRIDRYYTGTVDDPKDILFEPMLCAQCDNAPCETVCPVAATVHGHDGLNNQAYNRCVGTRYCANNCPYKVRRFNWLDYTPKDPIERLVLNPDVVVRERGVMEKCTFCVQRIQRARIEAKRDGKSGPLEFQTACQQSCPAKAIHFGDGASKESGIAELQESNRAFQVLADTGVQPSITYLARVRRRDKRGESS